MAIGLEELKSSLVEETVDVARACKGLVVAIGILLCEETSVVLELDVGRIADDDIEAVCHAKHPIGVEERRHSVLVIGVPVGELLGVGGGEIGILGEESSELLTEAMILLSKGGLAACGLGDKVFPTDTFKLLLERIYLLAVIEERALALHLEGYEGVGSDELGLEVRERRNPEIGLGGVFLAIADE